MYTVPVQSVVATFTSTGTWTAPSGVSEVEYLVVLVVGVVVETAVVVVEPVDSVLVRVYLLPLELITP